MMRSRETAPNCQSCMGFAGRRCQALGAIVGGVIAIACQLGAMGQVHHEQLRALGESLAEPIKSEFKLHDFSLSLVRDGVAARSGKPVACFWLMYRFEGREGSWAGGGKIEGVLVLQLTPLLVNSDWAIEASAFILSARPARWGPGGALMDGEGRALADIRSKLAGLDAAARRVAVEATKAAKSQFPKLPGSGYIPISSAQIAKVASELFPLQQGVVVPSANDYANHSSGDMSNAALIVILIRQTDVNAIVWRRSNDMPAPGHEGRVISKESRMPSHSIRILAMTRGEVVPELGKLRRGDGQWNDEVGCVIVIPGPAYNGERLHLYGHSKKDGRWPGGEVWCPPGFYSLAIKKRDVPDPNARRAQYMNEAASSISVEASGR